MCSETFPKTAKKKNKCFIPIFDVNLNVLSNSSYVYIIWTYYLCMSERCPNQVGIIKKGDTYRIFLNSLKVDAVKFVIIIKLRFLVPFPLLRFIYLLFFIV